jgi:hypothetical protein
VYTVVYSLVVLIEESRKEKAMKNLNLAIHGGSHTMVSVEELAKVETPEAEKTWFPIPHARLLESVKKTVEKSGLHVVTEAHAIAKEGLRYFGLLQLANGKNPDDYSLVVGLRNSHDKSIVAGLAVGAGVHVCDNLSFSSEIVIDRKHTRFIDRDLPTLIESAVGRLGDARRHQDDRIAAYKRTEITDGQAHDLVIQALDARIVPVTRIPEILKEWREPRHPEFRESRNAWRLMNGFTEVLKESSLFQRPVATQALHGLLDTVSGLLVSSN